MTQAKILIWDIEMSFALYFAYPEKKPQYLPASRIYQHQVMMSAAWAWFDPNAPLSKIHSFSTVKDPKKFKKNFRDHTSVLWALREVIDEADILVGHNSDGFDLKHFNYLCWKAGIPPVGPKHTIDTLKQARKVFNAPSNSLDELVKSRGLGQAKMKLPENTWPEATLGCPKAIKAIEEYNRHDILIQDRLVRDMLPWMTNLPAFRDSTPGDIACPKCGETDQRKMQKRGFRYNKQRTKKAQFYCCKTCERSHGRPSWFLGPYVKI